MILRICKKLSVPVGGEVEPPCLNRMRLGSQASSSSYHRGVLCWTRPWKWMAPLASPMFMQAPKGFTSVPIARIRRLRFWPCTVYTLASQNIFNFKVNLKLIMDKQTHTLLIRDGAAWQWVISVISKTQLQVPASSVDNDFIYNLKKLNQYKAETMLY